MKGPSTVNLKLREGLVTQYYYLLTIFPAVQQGRGPPTSQSLMGYGFGDYASFPSPGHAPTYLSSYISALVRAEPYPAAR